MQLSNKVEPSSPPPYDEFNQPIPPPPYAPSAPSISPSKSAFSNIDQKMSDSNSHNEFFKEPPKFLLYPNVPPEGRSDHASSNPQPQQTCEMQTAPVPSSFPVVAYPHPQPGVIPVQPQQIPQVTYVTQQVPNSAYSQNLICPHCKVQVMTTTEYTSGLAVHLAALGTCFIGSFFCCCCLGCVPYFINQMKNVEHICPLCGKIIGIYKRYNL